MECTEDKLLGGRVTLRQPARGYRAAMDPVLLAASVPAKPGQSVLELGCGTGAAILCLNARVEGLKLSVLERDPAMLLLARENAVMNTADITFHEGAVGGERGGKHGLPPQAFDHVLFNPPFFEDHDPSPYETRNAAHRLDTGLGEWVEAARLALKPQGCVTMILAAHQLGAALAGLEPKFGAIEVLPIRPYMHKVASRVLIRAVVGRRTKLALLPDLILHDDHGHSQASDAVLRHAAAVENQGQ